jgi:hypothetical protein
MFVDTNRSSLVVQSCHRKNEQWRKAERLEDSKVWYPEDKQDKENGGPGSTFENRVS